MIGASQVLSWSALLALLTPPAGRWLHLSSGVRARRRCGMARCADARGEAEGGEGYFHGAV